MHSQDVCKALTRCKNCEGSHRSDSRRCLVRPTRAGLPTKEQLKFFRQAGEREFNAVAWAKAVEEKAAEATGVSTTNTPDSSLPIEIITEAAQTPPVQITAGDKMRL